jgi:hypothetical protein
MRNRFAFMYGLEGGDYNTPKPTEEPAVVETAIVTPDTTGSVDTTTTPDAVIEDASDNSSTVVIDTQDEPAKPDLVPKKQLVFLGGTCNESTWRNKLIEGLKMSYFNPVVQDWKEDDKEKENQIKDSADFNLFVFTPKHTGYFSFVEASLLAVKSSSRTILCVLQDDDGVAFEEDLSRSIKAICEELAKEGIKVFDNLDDVRSFLNGKEDPNGEQEAPVVEETPSSDNSVVMGNPIKQRDLIDAGKKASAELETNDAVVKVDVESSSGKEDEKDEDKNDA